MDRSRIDAVTGRQQAARRLVERADLGVSCWRLGQRHARGALGLSALVSALSNIAMMLISIERDTIPLSKQGQQ
jgi:hypothetical protein